MKTKRSIKAYGDNETIKAICLLILLTGVGIALVFLALEPYDDSSHARESYSSIIGSGYAKNLTLCKDAEVVITNIVTAHGDSYKKMLPLEICEFIIESDDFYAQSRSEEPPDLSDFEDRLTTDVTPADNPNTPNALPKIALSGTENLFLAEFPEPITFLELRTVTQSPTLWNTEETKIKWTAYYTDMGIYCSRYLFFLPESWLKENSKYEDWSELFAIAG